MTTPTSPNGQPDDGSRIVLQPRRPENGLAVRSLESGLVLRDATAEEFLPSVRPWVRAVGLLMVGSFVTGLGLLAVWPYRVVVRGPGQIRPSGETSVIHSPLAGRLRALRVRSNQTVQQGEVIAELDPADLEGKRDELANRRAALERQQQALVRQSEASGGSRPAGGGEGPGRPRSGADRIRALLNPGQQWSDRAPAAR
ncbi:MAG: biotin/lipoyl-binding protein [Prochlorococcaceae cyanobacterium]